MPYQSHATIFPEIQKRRCRFSPVSRPHSSRVSCHSPSVSFPRPVAAASDRSLGARHIDVEHGGTFGFEYAVGVEAKGYGQGRDPV
jgi:hypothetical protein